MTRIIVLERHIFRTSAIGLVIIENIARIANYLYASESCLIIVETFRAHQA